MNDRRKVLLGLGTASAVTAWHKPIVNAVLLPAHAQTSVCPNIVVGNVQSTALSGADSFTSCGAVFDVFSDDPALAIQITSIATGPLGPGVAVSNDGLGPATSTSGPRVTWIGPISGSAPGDCVDPADIVPATPVTFTISASCPSVPGADPVQLVIGLADILGGATGA